jgi:hypothetical protein
MSRTPQSACSANSPKVLLFRSFYPRRSPSKWDLASIRTEEVQLSYREKLGERPAVLCALAEAVIGPWAQRGQLAPE